MSRQKKILFGCEIWNLPTFSFLNYLLFKSFSEFLDRPRRRFFLCLDLVSEWESINHEIFHLRGALQMAWKFKDRYMPGEVITIPFDITQKLHKLNDTLDAYRWYELLPAKEREKTIGDGGILADILTKHVMCAYYIGWFDIEDDEAFENYKKDFRKFFIEPHPAFAACRFAACLSFIRHQRKLIEQCEFLKSIEEPDSIFTNTKLNIENQNNSWD